MLIARVRSVTALVVFLLIAFMSPHGAAQDGSDTRAAPVHGRVLDATGKPAAAAQLGIDWSRMEIIPAPEGAAPDSGVWCRVTDRWKATEPITADAAGAFRGVIKPRQKKTWLIAWSQDGQQAGWVPVTAGSDVDLEIRLRRTVRVRGTVDYEGLTIPPESLTCDWRASDVPDAGALSSLAARTVARDPGPRLAGSNTDDGRFDVRLPEGRFAWDIADQYGQLVRKFVTVTADTPEDFVLPAVHLEPAYMVRNKGQVLDDLPTALVRGLPPEQANLSALRGKWVLIEFWGYW